MNYESVVGIFHIHLSIIRLKMVWCLWLFIAVYIIFLHAAVSSCDDATDQLWNIQSDKS